MAIAVTVMAVAVTLVVTAAGVVVAVNVVTVVAVSVTVMAYLGWAGFDGEHVSRLRLDGSPIRNLRRTAANISTYCSQISGYMSPPSTWAP